MSNFRGKVSRRGLLKTGVAGGTNTLKILQVLEP